MKWLQSLKCPFGGSLGYQEACLGGVFAEIQLQKRWEDLWGERGLGPQSLSLACRSCCTQRTGTETRQSVQSLLCSRRFLVLKKWVLWGPDPLCSSLDWSWCKKGFTFPFFLPAAGITLLRFLEIYPPSQTPLWLNFLTSLNHTTYMVRLTRFAHYPLLETQKPGWFSLFINVFLSKSVFPPTLSLQVPLSFPRASLCRWDTSTIS